MSTAIGQVVYEVVLGFGVVVIAGLLCAIAYMVKQNMDKGWGVALVVIAAALAICWAIGSIVVRYYPQ